MSIWLCDHDSDSDMWQVCDCCDYDITLYPNYKNKIKNKNEVSYL